MGDQGGVGDWEAGEFSIEGDIAGTIKSDQNYEAIVVGDRCQLSGAVGIKPGEGSLVAVSSGIETYGGGIGENGAYSVTVPISEGEYLATLLTGGPENWRCTCPANCVYGGITAPESDVDFFVSTFRRAWFQVDGGNLHADLGGVASLIPSSCVQPLCQPYLITGSSGLVSYTGSLSLGDFGAEAINQSGDRWRAQTGYQGNRTDYAYFSRILADDPDGVGTWGGTEPTEDGVFLGEGVEQTLGGEWSITGGQKTVLLAPGDLVIKNNIVVEEGSFLAIIVSGDITVDDAVGNIEGVYIADGMINTCETGSNQQLVGEGIFVGWTGINLCRDYGDKTNNTSPVEMFVYRPDLQRNAYDYLMMADYSWKEVAP